MTDPEAMDRDEWRDDREAAALIRAIEEEPEEDTARHISNLQVDLAAAREEVEQLREALEAADRYIAHVEMWGFDGDSSGPQAKWNAARAALDTFRIRACERQPHLDLPRPADTTGEGGTDG